jgi:serine/threonine-protein kinase HipA
MLLDRYAADPEAELERLARIATFTVAIGNADAHGKNLALIHDTPGTVTLAPLYDTVPTILWPNLSPALAMSLNGVFDLATVEIEDVVAEASNWPFPRKRATRAAVTTLEAMRDALDHGVLDDETLLRVIGNRVENLLAGRPAGEADANHEDRLSA